MLFSRFLIVAILFSVATAVCVPSQAFAADEKESDKKPETVAVFDLDHPITDKPTPDDPLFGEIGGESLRAMLNRMETAKVVDDVAALVVLVGSSSLGTAQLHEMASAIKEITKTKPVYAHSDSLTTGTYATISGATRISLSPTGDAWVNGLYGEQMYLRGLLDMVGVQPDFLTCGDYKSAAETFMRKGPSDEAQKMTDWLFDSLIAEIKKTIAKGREVDAAKVDEWINQGIFSGETAKESGLTDAVETREDLTNFIQKAHGVEVEFNKKYGKKTGPEIDLNNPFAAIQLWSKILSGGKEKRSTKDSIAIVHIDGAIMLGKRKPSAFGGTEAAYSEEIRKALDKLAFEPRVKGVVVRVNSPGGSATASEIMLQAIRRVNEKKPVVVSMGDYAASGGYYVSCRADKIFASPTTITGSIGVVAGKLATVNMWNRIGINFKPVERGDKAGILKSSRPFEDDEREELQDWMNQIYGVFKDHVVDGRKDKLSKEIDEIAGGRVYTGTQALELGLVDELGGLNEAVAYLVDDLKLEDYEVQTVPKAQNFLELLFEDLSPDKDENDRRLSVGIWSTLAPTLKNVDPHRVEILQKTLQQLDFLAKERVMLTSPILDIR